MLSASSGKARTNNCSWFVTHLYKSIDPHSHRIQEIQVYLFAFTIFSILSSSVNQLPHTHCQQNAKHCGLPNTLWTMDTTKITRI